MGNSEQVLNDYIKSKYDVNLNDLLDCEYDGEHELDDMDIYYLVKILNSLPVYHDELSANDKLYKQLNDNQDQLESFLEQVKNSNEIPLKKRKLLQEELKDGLDKICYGKFHLICNYIETEIGITEAGHIDYKQEEANLYNHFKNVNLLASDEGEYTFEKYMRNIFKYQYEFYKLSDHIDDRKKIIYEKLAFGNNWQDDLNKLFAEERPMEFKLSINMMKPKDVLKKELNSFHETVNSVIDLYNVILNRAIYFYKTDLISGIDGRAIYKGDPDKIFVKWQLYLDAFTLHQAGFDFCEVYDKLHAGKKISNPYFTTNLYVNTAKKLIKAAEQGTFPYSIVENPSTS